MSDLFISLIGPAIRSNRYEIIYNNLNFNNKIPFEIVFAGDKQPERTISSNFKYIYTKVKPSQCLEICARNAIGEYVMQITDDLVFTPEFLNRMYKHIQNNESKNNMVTPSYQKGEKYDDSILNNSFRKLYFDKSKKDSPRVGVCAAYKRKVWNELGGVDNRFLGSYDIIDISMRFSEIGYGLFDAPDCCVYELVKLRDFVRLIKRSNESESLALLNDLWTKEGKILNKRNFPVHSFVDKNILIESQGNIDKSKWD